LTVYNVRGVGGGVVKPETRSGGGSGGGTRQRDSGALFPVVRLVVYVYS